MPDPATCSSSPSSVARTDGVTVRLLGLEASSRAAGRLPNCASIMPGSDLAGMVAALELWGGLECSVLQVRDGLRDQFRETGHHDRIADLDAVAALGIRRLRYPVS